MVIYEVQKNTSSPEALLVKTFVWRAALRYKTQCSDTQTYWKTAADYDLALPYEYKSDKDTMRLDWQGARAGMNDGVGPILY